MAKYVTRDRSKSFTHLILWATLIFLICFAIGASFLKVDVVTRALGRVVPSKHLQVIESLDPGIIKKVYIKTGDIVKKDQIIIQLDDVRIKGEYQKGIQEAIGLKVRIAGLRAVGLNKPFTVDPILAKSAPILVESEKALYNSKQAELAALKQRIALTQKEIDLSAPLVKEGVMSTVELLRLQRDLGQLQGALANIYSTALADLNEAEDKLAQIQEANTINRDRLDRTTIRSPMYGIVKQVLITTEGGVTKPGDPIAEIVPLDDTLLIEAIVSPSDIAFLHLNQKAEVKITAYDYTIYGGIEGYIETIGTDTYKDDKGNSFYKIWIRTHRNYVSFHGKNYLILPGMVASVDILTGRRTLMHYILKPFMRVREAALIER